MKEKQVKIQALNALITKFEKKGDRKILEAFAAVNKRLTNSPIGMRARTAKISLLTNIKNEINKSEMSNIGDITIDYKKIINNEIAKIYWEYNRLYGLDWKYFTSNILKGKTLNLLTRFGYQLSENVPRLVNQNTVPPQQQQQRQHNPTNNRPASLSLGVKLDIMGMVEIRTKNELLANDISTRLRVNIAALSSPVFENGEYVIRLTQIQFNQLENNYKNEKDKILFTHNKQIYSVRFNCTAKELNQNISHDVISVNTITSNTVTSTNVNTTTTTASMNPPTPVVPLSNDFNRMVQGMTLSSDIEESDFSNSEYLDISTKKDDPLKEYFNCSLTLTTMENPFAILTTGQTYEETEIKGWLSNNKTDPNTQRAVSINDLVPNRLFRKMIVHWAKGAKEELEKCFICPILGEIMTDPIILETGRTVDRKSIKEHDYCPYTGKTIKKTGRIQYQYCCQKCDRGISKNL